MGRVSFEFLLSVVLLSSVGCFAVTYKEPHNLGRGTREDEAPARAIASYFELRPELEVPVRVAVVEFGTTDFSRLFTPNSAPGAGASDPLQRGDLIATVMPFTGSSLLGSDASETSLRLAAARAQADILILVDFRYRNAFQQSVFSLLNYVLIGAILPVERDFTEVVGRGTIIDVRNGLIYGISEARVRGPERLRTRIGAETSLEEDRETLRRDLYLALAARVADQIRLAQEKAKATK